MKTKNPQVVHFGIRRLIAMRQLCMSRSHNGVENFPVLTTYLSELPAGEPEISADKMLSDWAMQAVLSEAVQISTHSEFCGEFIHGR